jgi:membrane protease YdiL (CAAX protease family)
MDADAAAGWAALLGSWDGRLLAVVLAVGVPIYGHFRYRRLLARPGADAPSGIKLRMYATVIGMQWLLTVIMLLVARRHGLTPADVGQRLGDPRLTLGLAAGLLILPAILLVFNLGRIRRSPADRLETSVGRLRKFMPATSTELAGFFLLALTAGICEELLYRGFMVGLLGTVLGSPWYGVLAGAIVFGFGHAYQGRKGVLLTGLSGLILGALFVGAGSLLPGQVLHAAFDVAGGFAGAAMLARLPRTA